MSKVYGVLGDWLWWGLIVACGFVVMMLVTASIVSSLDRTPTDLYEVRGDHE